jgi:alpha-tubulin suppressor-like RCC1 family protein
MRPCIPSSVSCRVPIAVLLIGLAACQDAGQSPTAPDAPSSLAVSTAAALSFRQVSAGDDHTCGVTTANRAYCWGRGQTTPAAVSGGLQFLSVSAGMNHSCGISSTNRVYCWTATNLSPLQVPTTRRFKQVSAGADYTCGITLADGAYCWGRNEYGVFGNGSFFGTHESPVAVAGGHKWLQVTAAYSHTCGVTTDNRGFCWGNNTNHQLGDGTAQRSRLKPAAIVGGLSFREVRPGSGYISPASSDIAPDHAVTCGITTDNRAYCWGSGGVGTGGSGSATPAAVATERRFSTLSTGVRQTCAIALSARVWCWGGSTTPAALPGGLYFRGVSSSAIGGHACGVTTDNRAFCWGASSSPVPVAGTT